MGLGVVQSVQRGPKDCRRRQPLLLTTSSTDENIEKMKEIVLNNSHSNIKEIARDDLS